MLHVVPETGGTLMRLSYYIFHCPLFNQYRPKHIFTQKWKCERKVSERSEIKIMFISSEIRKMRNFSETQKYLKCPRFTHLILSPDVTMGMSGRPEKKLIARHRPRRFPRIASSIPAECALN